MAKLTHYNNTQYVLNSVGYLIFIGPCIIVIIENKRPLHVICYFYFTSYAPDMFRTLIYPSSGACNCAVELPHWNFFYTAFPEY